MNSKVKGVRFPMKILSLVEDIAPQVNENPNEFVVKAVMARIAQIYAQETMKAGIQLLMPKIEQKIVG